MKETDREAAEAEVRREARLAGQERLRCHFGPAERGDPGLALQVPFEATQSLRLAAFPDGRHEAVRVKAQLFQGGHAVPIASGQRLDVVVIFDGRVTSADEIERHVRLGRRRRVHHGHDVLELTVRQRSLAPVLGDDPDELKV